MRRFACVSRRAEQTPIYSGQASALRNSISVKQGRRACGIFRTSPHPVIQDSLGKSKTRRVHPKDQGVQRVPAPSHLAQRDAAKTHVSPGPYPRAPGAKPNSWVPFTWRTCRFGGIRKRIDNPKIILDPAHFLKRSISAAANVTGLVVIAYKQWEVLFMPQT